MIYFLLTSLGNACVGIQPQQCYMYSDHAGIRRPSLAGLWVLINFGVSCVSTISLDYLFGVVFSFNVLLPFFNLTIHFSFTRIGPYGISGQFDFKTVFVL